MSEENLQPNVPVGQRLKARRQQLRISLAQVEIATKIRGKFLTALESGDYTTLPNDIYSRGFVQHYANHLGLDGSLIAAQYVAERGGILTGDTRQPRLEKPPRLILTRRLLAVGLVLIAITGVVSYLLYQFSALAAPPRLAITSPESDQSVNGGIIDLGGHATPGSDITVDDSPVAADADGNFSEKVALQDGVNSIRVTARSKLGKTTVATRNILAHLPKLDAAAAAVPTTTFDGIAVAVSVKDAATSLVVTVDGAEAFRGTFVPGKSQLFQGKNDVNITTGNAGVTSVVVTNTVVAGKKISPLGHDGEIRRGQDFARDTVIP